MYIQLDIAQPNSKMSILATNLTTCFKHKSQVTLGSLCLEIPANQDFIFSLKKTTHILSDHLL